MSEDGQKQRQGWGKAGRKYHYFAGTRSLCGKWACGGALDLAPDDGAMTTEDCADCRRRLTAIQEREAKGIELTPGADMSGAVNTGGIPRADHAVKKGGRVHLKAGKGKGGTTKGTKGTKGDKA